MISPAGEEAYYLSPECVEILQPMLQVFKSKAVLDRSVSMHGNISKPPHPLQAILPLPGQNSVDHEMLEEIALFPRDTRSEVAVEERADVKDRRDRILDSPGDTVLYQSKLNKCLEDSGRSSLIRAIDSSSSFNLMYRRSLLIRFTGSPSGPYNHINDV